MDQQAFTEALIRIRDARHAQNHPYIEDWTQGKLTRLQMAHYVLQHSRWSREVVNAFGVIEAMALDVKVQDDFIANLAQEHGLLGIEHGQAPMPHVEMQMRFIESCGISREEANRIPTTAGARAQADFHWSLVFRRPWQVAATAVWANESQEVGIMQRLVPALINHYGYQSGSDAIRFFEEHYMADQEHGGRELEALVRHVTDPALQQECLEVAEMATRVRWLFLNELYELVHEPAALGRAS
jgi:pyrroloquinoline quinone (PQQ) biosynthesis protein C